MSVDIATLGRCVEESLSAAKVTFSRFGAKLELPEVHLPNIDAANDVLRMLQHRSNGPSDE